jgi:CubicO group peptidase (beta-lactamase class C family)
MIMRLRKTTIAVLLAGAQCLAACFAFAASPEPQASETVWPTKGWETSTAEEQGMDSGALAQLVDTVGSYKQDSLLIVRHGKIVTEVYYAPYAAGISHQVKSVTKSVISTLVAIALREGILDSVDHPVLDLFSDRPIENVDDRKKMITVQNLLDMTSGLNWKEEKYAPDETITRMFESSDPTQFVLNQPMSDVPGTRFYYNGGNPYVLSALITKKTGKSAFEFARKELFGPLGIESADWGHTDAQGVTNGEGWLLLTPRDMAKVGYLYLRGGIWDGKPMIASSWVDRASEGAVKTYSGFHYANLWWSLPEKGAYMAFGHNSQIIIVLPKLDIVAVITGALRPEERYQSRVPRLIDQIASSVKSDQPLPVDPIGQSLLAASLREAANERPSPVGEIPETAKLISGKSYRLDDNPLHVKTLSLNLMGAVPSWEHTRDMPVLRLTTPIGLDGRFRVSGPTPLGIFALKGRWVSEHTFAVERRFLGHGETQSWMLTFVGKSVDVSFEDTNGYKVKMHGEQVE